MLSYVTKGVQWLAQALHLTSQKVKLSKSEEKDATSKALNLLHLIEDRKFTEALAGGTKTIKLLVSPKALEKAFNDLEKSQGKLSGFKTVGVEGYGDKKVVKVLLSFEKLSLLAVITIDSSGLIAGFRIKPAGDAAASRWKAPSYAYPKIFEEQDLTLKTEEGTVRATISMPKGNIEAGVLFLAGSGPADRDSTIEPNKPLKDLAWGLASKGVAICRWDKLSSETSAGLSEDITLEREYLPFAREGLAALKKRLSQRAADIPIFILGHSLGGIILLSAGAEKMYNSALRQMRYLASLDQDPPLVTPEFLEVFSKQVAMVSQPDFNAQMPKEDMPLGAPASYWVSVKDYDQVAALKGFCGPVFIGQGARDYQVTVGEDLKIWLSGVDGRENVKHVVFENIGHLLLANKHTSGTHSGLETPDDYTIEGHVDENVIVCIHSWIRDHCQVEIS